MNLQVHIESVSAEPVPDEDDIRRWISATLAIQQLQATQQLPATQQLDAAELSLRIVDADEMASLNQTYRGKQGPTNVLSFPADLPESLKLPLLGDIVICAPVVRREADEQAKPLSAHWAHMAVHGTLHLLGYDHIHEEDARIMETLETRILNSLDINNPYDVPNHNEEHLAEGAAGHE